MSRSKTRAAKHWELRSSKPKKVERSQTLDDFRREAMLAIGDVKKRTQWMNEPDGKKYLALVYWMMADECGLIPHGAMESDPLKETNEDPRTSWAAKLTIEFGTTHRGKLIKDLPDKYVEWILAQESSFFRQVQDAIRIMNGTQT